MKPVLKNSREDLLMWLKGSVPDPPYENPMPGQELQIVTFRTTYDREKKEDRRTTSDLEKATSISSRYALSFDDIHKPILDIDFPVKAIGSSTPGHFHLYIDKEMPWYDYELLLRAMTVVGLLEPGYLDASLKRKHTSVRLPWVRKPEPEPPF